MDYSYTAESAASEAGMSQGTFLRYARGCGVYRQGGSYTMADIRKVMQARAMKKGGKA